VTEKPSPRSPESLPEELAARIEKRWQEAYGTQSETDLRDFYADWAETYDEDHAAIGCFHHQAAVELLLQFLPDPAAAILDVGAGTGLVGEALQARGFSNLTAIDFSPDILAVARRKGLYRRYLVQNLNQPLRDLVENSFDAAIGVGVFSFGQVEAVALDELVRIVRPEGLITFTLRVDFFESNAMGFREKLAGLSEAGTWQLHALSEPAQYLPRKEPEAMFRTWLYRLSG
jgi:ubiquinone/menaquinone biosynthesis C-methylase UbiE